MTATILSTTVSGNSAGSVVASPNFFGGRAYITIIDCTISGNFRTTGGGGIFATNTSLSVANSTISGNSTGSGGGCISVSGSGLVPGSSIVNSTISGNSAGTSGGGIYNNSSLYVTLSTITGNSVPSGGGIYNVGSVEVSNTILNAGASGENIFNDGGTVTSFGYNLSSDDGGGYFTARAIRSTPIRCLVLCRITAAQPLRTRYYPAAQRLTPAIRTSLRRLRTTSETVISIACSTVAST